MTAGITPLIRPADSLTRCPPERSTSWSSLPGCADEHHRSVAVAPGAGSTPLTGARNPITP